MNRLSVRSSRLQEIYHVLAERRCRSALHHLGQTPDGVAEFGAVPRRIRERVRAFSDRTPAPILRTNATDGEATSPPIDGSCRSGLIESL